MIDREADVTFYVPISLLLKLLSLFCMSCGSMQRMFWTCCYIQAVFLWLSAKFCSSERTSFLMNCFFLVFVFLVIKSFEYTVFVPRISLSSRSILDVLRQSP